ncbi:uncharacterized protein METZ01_LOCUS510167, partial [marine metagenome]
MMKLITKILLPLCLLLPITTFGETMDDLVERDGLFYKKFTVVPFTGEITEKTLQGTFRNGKKDGLWVEYYEDGQLSYKGTYKDGKQDGPWVYYSDKGQLQSKGTYRDGEGTGPWVYYHDNGQLWEKGNYK